MSKAACECETATVLPDAGAVQLCARGGAGSASPRADDAGAPAESVLLRVPDGVGLGHLFGAALRRDASTKGSSNPKAAAEAAARKGAPSADSRRLLPATTAAASSKTAVVIGVLPASKVKVAVAKERRAPGRAVVARAWRRPAAGARVFASEAVGPEPVSPKVSCFGAVLSERSAAARREGGEEGEESGAGGCWASLGAALLGLCCSGDGREGRHLCRASEPNPKATALEPHRRQCVAVTSPPRPVAGLGDVKRLASRRWPETMARETV
ncbi:uncharacterized protein LOC103646497 [Zea mays]|jgi:hypothetical protein|uniref:Uncharacterized protein n=1 Tax=Zea mays TaxID=4577 RepID=A0A1D6EBI7_MAIZE|nr:uncharacterized protein LOC103646497 [Zea mays]ONM17705.1 hypothetical protein ZEAMMB73_Zm00001d003780 [Zea mays]|eukprot:NP_001339273.1 uncharacterized protein LOC103646497 [Zea mays]